MDQLFNGSLLVTIIVGIVMGMLIGSVLCLLLGLWVAQNIGWRPFQRDLLWSPFPRPNYRDATKIKPIQP